MRHDRHNGSCGGRSHEMASGGRRFKGHFRGDGDKGFGRGRGRGRRGMFDGAELRLALLKLIADEPRHGYDLIKAVEDMAGGEYAPSPGIIYPALSFLEDAGQIEPLAAEGSRKAFQATESGKSELAQNDEQITALIARLAILAEKGERMDAAPVKRAMENLRNVLRARLHHPESSKETALDIAELLNDAAQKIERL